MAFASSAMTFERVPPEISPTLTEIPADFEPTVVGRATQMELVEVIQNPDFSWEELPGGDCFYVDNWLFDTRPNDGAGGIAPIVPRASLCANIVVSRTNSTEMIRPLMANTRPSTNNAVRNPYASAAATPHTSSRPPWTPQ